MRRQALTLAAALLVSLGSLDAQAPVNSEVGEWMARVGARVEAYFERAQSLICEETIRVEPLGADLLSNGEHARELVYELRVSWGPDARSGDQASAPTVLRQLLRVDGHAPRPRDEPGCFDREPVSPEPLAMFLPMRQDDYRFGWKGPARDGGRAAIALDYKPAKAQPAEVTWKGDCLKIELPGHTRGRFWVDPVTADILRLDEALTGPFDVRVPPPPDRRRRGGAPTSLVMERVDSSTVYRAVTFRDPDETLMLPASVLSLQVIHNAGTPRLRTRQTYAKYRRFLTDVRILQ